MDPPYYNIHGILNLVLAGNSNVVEITKEGLPYSNHLPLPSCSRDITSAMILLRAASLKAVYKQL